MIIFINYHIIVSSVESVVLSLTAIKPASFIVWGFDLSERLSLFRFEKWLIEV